MTKETASNPQTIEVYISNLSLPLGLLALGNVHDHADYLQAINADGEEITPTNGSPMMNQVYQRGLEYSALPCDQDGADQSRLGAEVLIPPVFTDKPSLDATIRQVVRSGHQSFRNVTFDNGLLARTVPKWPASMKRLEIIQQITGPFPIVVYPYFSKHGDSSPGRKTIQPKAHEWQKMGIHEDSPISEIEAALRRIGVQGFTFDVFHAQASMNEVSFQDPVALAGRLAAAGLVHSAHLALGRLDMTGFSSFASKSTLLARAAFKRSSAQAARTFEGAMLQALAPGLHTLPSSIKPFVVLEDGPIRMPVHDTRNHAAIIETTRSLIR